MDLPKDNLHQILINMLEPGERVATLVFFHTKETAIPHQGKDRTAPFPNKQVMKYQTGKPYLKALVWGPLCPFVRLDTDKRTIFIQPEQIWFAAKQGPLTLFKNRKGTE
jgi:hypothetical protein